MINVRLNETGCGEKQESERVIICMQRVIKSIVKNAFFKTLRLLWQASLHVKLFSCNSWSNDAFIAI